MWGALAIMVLTASPRVSPEARTAFEVKCLYCHSEDVALGPRLKPSGWRALNLRMRAKAPLLISRREVDLITRYLVYGLKRVPPEEPKPPRPTVAPGPLPTATVAPPPPPLPEELEPIAETLPEVRLPPDPPVDVEAEQRGPEVLESKCSKCHTLTRVYAKVGSLETGVATIERMRRKTGSGITAADAEILVRFLRTRL